MQKKYKIYSQQNAQNETMLQYTRWDLRTALANLLTILIKGKGFSDYVITCEVLYWEQAIFGGTNLETNAMKDVIFSPSGCFWYVVY